MNDILVSDFYLYIFFLFCFLCILKNAWVLLFKSYVSPAGYYTHVSTLADVQENVMEYLHVLSRPMVINHDHDIIWTEAYMDSVVSVLLLFLACMLGHTHCLLASVSSGMPYHSVPHWSHHENIKTVHLFFDSLHRFKIFTPIPPSPTVVGKEKLQLPFKKIKGDRL